MTHSEPVALAIDVGGTGIKCGLVDLDGVIRHAERHPTHAERGPDAVVTTILDVAAALAATARASGFDPVSAGVIVPAVVADGIAVFAANLGLRDVPLRDLLTKRLDLPAALGHDVRSAALAEARLGAGRTTRRLLFIALGTGIAGGFVLDGQVDDGAHGGAGEIGHITVRTGLDARPCGCGGRGCLETYASAAAIARSYAAAAAPACGYAASGAPAPSCAAPAAHAPSSAAPAAPAPSTTPAGDPYRRAEANRGPLLAPDARVVAELVEAGDPIATSVWTEAVEALADGLLTGIALYDPSVVAIGGGLALAGATLLEPVRASLRQRRTFHQLPEVVAAELGEEAGVHGAALLALDAAGYVG